MSTISDRLGVAGTFAYANWPTTLHTFEMTKHVINKKIPGVLVECGVGAGSQIGAMALACEELNHVRPIYAFDSYEGIPMASEKDDCQPGVGYFATPKEFVSDKRSLLVSSGVSSHSLEAVRLTLSTKLLISLDNIKFIKGWFQDTLETVSKEIESIAILRLDGDLYESTKVCIEHLFDKLSPGGILIIDDWVLKGCRAACDEYLDYKKLSKLKTIPGSAVVWFVKK